MKKVRLSVLISVQRREKLDAYVKRSDMSLTQVIEFLIDTLRNPKKRNKEEE